jgi:hypothetical protein
MVSPQSSALKKLDTIQAMAGRQILGKSGNSNVINEAVLGDLGWLSIKSCLRLSKIRLFGRLMSLPSDNLAKRVFLTAKARYETHELPLFEAVRPSSWCNDAYLALKSVGLSDMWVHGIPAHFLTNPAAFKRVTKRRVRLLDIQEWHASLACAFDSPAESHAQMPARELYRSVKPCYGRELYLGQDDRKSSLLKFYLRSGNFGLNARIHHGIPSPAVMTQKGCRLCDGNPFDDEEYFMLRCSAFSKSRQLMWSNIEGNLVHLGLFYVWHSVHGAVPSDQLLYLLGKVEAHWSPEAASIIDSAVRQYLRRACDNWKLLLAVT